MRATGVSVRWFDGSSHRRSSFSRLCFGEVGLKRRRGLRARRHERRDQQHARRGLGGERRGRRARGQAGRGCGGDRRERDHDQAVFAERRAGGDRRQRRLQEFVGRGQRAGVSGAHAAPAAPSGHGGCTIVSSSCGGLPASSAGVVGERARRRARPAAEQRARRDRLPCRCRGPPPAARAPARSDGPASSISHTCVTGGSVAALVLLFGLRRSRRGRFVFPPAWCVAALAASSAARRCCARVCVVSSWARLRRCSPSAASRRWRPARPPLLLRRRARASRAAAAGSSSPATGSAPGRSPRPRRRRSRASPPPARRSRAPRARERATLGCLACCSSSGAELLVNREHGLGPQGFRTLSIK